MAVSESLLQGVNLVHVATLPFYIPADFHNFDSSLVRGHTQTVRVSRLRVHSLQDPSQDRVFRYDHRRGVHMIHMNGLSRHALHNEHGLGVNVRLRKTEWYIFADLCTPYATQRLYPNVVINPDISTIYVQPCRKVVIIIRAEAYPKPYPCHVPGSLVALGLTLISVDRPDSTVPA
ncbi:hypothetical protein K503DRAFT_609811 [Rhizopogon vinicolor AM-OR11-026]|uniref:Uncharacterized protein n=1 Tax=Rhizopogon vinicolor AM-OR11-026 TaxID=1314800 RepID=A0A1B7NG49_9AGAM|nr:hypothetical protein K503DRAFT_609811 [Rhizopogon vinicolor AM-OR11-026]